MMALMSNRANTVEIVRNIALLRRFKWRPLLSITLKNVYYWQSETSAITIPKTVVISEVQHLVTKVGQHEREDGILHKVIERAARHLV